MKTINPFFKYGLPMISFTVLGFAGLMQFVEGKNEIADKKKNRRVLTTREFDLEEDYKKTLAKLDIDEYEVVRIPRDPNETDE